MFEANGTMYQRAGYRPANVPGFRWTMLIRVTDDSRWKVLTLGATSEVQIGPGHVIEFDEVATEAVQLWKRWIAARQAKEARSDSATDRIEQETFDALVDYVEANDLNHTRLDPREV